jgi:hypothetical protein
MGPLSLFLWSRPGPLRPGLDHCPPSAMDLWSMGLAEDRRAHMWAPVCLPEAWNRVRKLAEDWEAAEDDLLFRPSFRKTPEPGRPMTRERAKL